MNKSGARDLMIEDDTSSVKTVLWNDKAMANIRSGDTVRITHLSPKKDIGTGIKLQSTKFSKIEVMLYVLNSLMDEILFSKYFSFLYSQ